MRRHIIFFKIVGSVAMAVTLTSLLSACGGKSNATAQDSEARPPATSDPKTAQDQRRWESESVARGPILETKAERESFFQDITEQVPTYSDEQLANDAEDQFRIKEEDLKKKNEEKPPIVVQEDEKHPEAVTEKSGTTKPVPKLTPKLESKLVTKPEPKATKPEPKATKPEPKATKPEPKATKPELKATKPAPKLTSKLERIPETKTFSGSGDLCNDLDVLSERGEVDLTSLYNDKVKLVSSMPSHQLKNMNSETRKNRFICILLPIAIRMNEEIFKQRLEVLRLQEKQKKGISLTDGDDLWLTDIKKAYGLSPQSSFEETLKRVDIIPLPLLLAQAALESGWGTSRATRELKNLFGMHASKGQACQKSLNGGGVCIRMFTSISQSVSAYIRLLNVGTAYSKFRDRRAQMRIDRQALDSLKLLAALGSYNETPAKYVRDVREIMTKSSKLSQFVFKEEKVAAH
jgi:Bax protein